MIEFRNDAVKIEKMNKLRRVNKILITFANPTSTAHYSECCRLPRATRLVNLGLNSKHSRL